MELKNFNTCTILLVPLIDDNITINDVNEESGFVNAYTEDINKPFHNDNVFLLYKVINTKQCLDTFSKLIKLDTLKTWRPVKINKEHYRVFVFHKVNNKNINNIINIGFCRNINDGLSIYNFWKTDFSYQFKEKLFNPSINSYETINCSVPKEDYYEGEDIIIY